jgi:hypothetical protein
MLLLDHSEGYLNSHSSPRPEGTREWYLPAPLRPQWCLFSNRFRLAPSTGERMFEWLVRIAPSLAEKYIGSEMTLCSHQGNSLSALNMDPRTHIHPILSQVSAIEDLSTFSSLPQLGSILVPCLSRHHRVSLRPSKALREDPSHSPSQRRREIQAF